jgi:hypothetical protein
MNKSIEEQLKIMKQALETIAKQEQEDWSGGGLTEYLQNEAEVALEQCE